MSSPPPPASPLDRSRTPLTARLNSLLTPAASPRPSFDNEAYTTAAEDGAMLAPRPRFRPQSLPNPSALPRRSSPSPTASPTSAAPPSAVDAMLKSVQDQLPLPVLRWLGGSKPTSPADSRPASPPRASLANLDEALHDSLPRAPSPAATRLSRFARPPPMLGSLTRSTLPTASLSTPSARVLGHLRETSYDLLPDAPVFLRNAPGSRRRSSVDTLRSLQQRELHTSAPSRIQPSTSTSKWWFQAGNKEQVDPLLAEDDRQGTAAEGEAHLQQKCTSRARSISVLLKK